MWNQKPIILKKYDQSEVETLPLIQVNYSHATLEYLTAVVTVSEGGRVQQTVSIQWSLPPQTRVDSFTIEAISRNTEVTEKDVLSFGAMEVTAEYTLQQQACFCFFFPQLLFSWTQCSKVHQN